MSIERIKFRAQNPRTKKWETVESFAEYWPDRPRETHAERLALFFDSCNGVNLDPATVGQWTGLVDSKGVEIYEGDRLKGIVREQGGAEKDWTNMETIDFVQMHKGVDCFGRSIADINNGRLYWMNPGHNNLKDSYWEIVNIEVIGNVHEVTT